MRVGAVRPPSRCVTAAAAKRDTRDTHGVTADRPVAFSLTLCAWWLWRSGRAWRSTSFSRHTGTLQHPPSYKKDLLQGGVTVRVTEPGTANATLRYSSSVAAVVVVFQHRANRGCGRGIL